MSFSTGSEDATLSLFGSEGPPAALGSAEVDAEYGLRYDASGNILGKWDPTLYANLNKDPIRREIQKYQDFIQKIGNAWWTTRKNPPITVTSRYRTSRIIYNVTDATYLELYKKRGLVNITGWSDFLNTYAVSPVSPSNVPGSDFADIEFTLEWEELFPYDGEYVFRAQADNIGRFYLDNQKILETTEFRQDQTPKIIKKTIKAGVHRIRIDLYNSPVMEKVLKNQAIQPVNDNYPCPGTKDMRGYIDYPGTLEGEPNQFGFDNDYPSAKKQGFTDADIRCYLQKIYLKIPGKRLGPKMQEVLKDPNWGKLDAISVQKSNSTKSTGTKTKKVFNTVDYIDKSDRKLWRFDPRAGRDSEFINQYGVLPFDPNSESAKIESFSGIHVIRWQFVEFPVDGNYNVEIMVDDSAVVYIGNRDGSGRQEIGNGLTDIKEGGDENIFRKSGSGKSFETRYFKSGKYRIRVELEQKNINDNYPCPGTKDMRGYDDSPADLNRFGLLYDYPIAKSLGFTDADIRYYLEKIYLKIPGKSLGPKMQKILLDPTWGRQGLTTLALGNPMGFAMNIETSSIEEDVVSSKSWNENPMGAALIIDAPNPPIPQEPIPLQEGRCPRNPIWTTRFPGAKEKWIPVNYVSLDPNQASWSSFTNRFAISPVRPLSTPGSDSGGIVYRNSWDLDLPYAGFYAFKSTVDNAGRILIDGIPIMQANYIPIVYRNTKGGDGAAQRSGISAIDDGIIYNWRNNNPKSKKIFLTKGVHKIEVEVENGITESFAMINKKIFSTSDWKYSSIGNGTKDMRGYDDYPGTPEGQPNQFGFDNDYPSARSQGFTDVDIRYYLETVYLKIPGKRLGPKMQKVLSDPTWGQLKSQGLLKGTTKDGVTYEGPTPIANYNFDDISPLLQDVNAFPNDEIQGKTWVFRWSKVNFPEDGEYNISIESDDSIVIFIGNNSKNGEIEISNGLNDINDSGDENIFRRSKSNNPGKSFETRYFKAGRYRIRVELTNLSVTNTGFQQNPTYFSLNITKSIRSSTGLSYSWTQNPMGIAAIMIPPPCPKIIKGKGVVTKIIVDDPGNSYPPPPPADPPLPAALEPAALEPTAVLPPDRGSLDRYPVCLILDEVIVEDSGINYNCGVDKLQIVPDNGVILDYNCDTFGRISEVKILNSGTCFSSYPNIFLPTDTGINATFRPVFRVVRDPVDLDLKNKLIQVTDLVGLKLTGYLEGRPYYGAVFYDNDIRFAGYYKTIGKPLQIYDTLQESIDSQVITPPSAIQRQGTDISSNDPRLNIPGTPGEII